MTSRSDRWKLRALRLAARLKIRAQRVWAGMRGTPLGTLIDRIVTGTTAIEPFDRAMTLAAQAFTSVVPIMIVVTALRPHKDSFASTLGDAIGLTDDVLATLAGSLPDSATVTSSVGFFGFLVAFFSATAYSRALERMYLKIWRVPKPPLRTAWRWIATIAAVMVAIALLALTQNILADRPAGTALEVAIRLGIWFVVWTYVPWVLMRATISLRALAFTGALTSIALTALAGVGRIYLPIVLTTGAEEFGVLGLVFTYISWLFVLSFGIVLATVVGRACAQDEGVLGRLVRGPSPEDANVPNLSADAWRRWGGIS
ncbi:YhjD/YihY/BrkB family envelope integrity protein [Cellulomonas sp. URHD0024]|uniref:YhjD/YihY/BrkB family envelope integrity protein n=1 Tax=Cellulomonas sp. URHD0024 TaxID=1302620 RepID=UPI0003FEBF93|nr:YhjD/YihY/BrkB family envelope integrity protein [Cellulomonas sp. URHD0024]